MSDDTTDKDDFFKILEKSSKPLTTGEEKSAESDGYTGTQTHQDSSEDTSD